MTTTNNLQLFSQNCEQLIGEDDLQQRLQSGRPLRIKAGFDPTAPDLHLGHYVLIKKMADLQQAGHEICFVVGDFTGMVGDPTDKVATRKALSREEVLKNAQTYADQVFTILDKNKTRVVFNSDWCNKLTAVDFVNLAASSTVARMLEREDFSKRFGDNQPIFIHEFLYPLLQGYDSVALEADVELGGTDQTFNLLMGRELQKKHGQLPQAVITLPLLEGLDGSKKMSKSASNYIAFTDTPNDMFGKLMSIGDALMWRYFAVLLPTTTAQIADMQQQTTQGKNPKDFKLLLAEQVTAIFHGCAVAKQAVVDFDKRFSQRQAPEDLDKIHLTIEPTGILLGALVVQVGMASSNSKAMQLIRQGAVKIDGQKITDSKRTLNVDRAFILQVGKLQIAQVCLVHKT